MTQVNRPNGINGVNNTGAAGKPSGDNPEILQAPGSGQAGSSGVSANVGLARIGLTQDTQDTQATEALAKANESPTETGVKNLILAVFHGDAGRAARGLLPARASFDDIKTLAGALTTPNYEQAA